VLRVEPFQNSLHCHIVFNIFQFLKGTWLFKVMPLRSFETSVTSHQSPSAAVLHSRGNETSESVVILYFHTVLCLTRFSPLELSVSYLPHHHPHQRYHPYQHCVLVCGKNRSSASQSLRTAASDGSDDDDDDEDDGSQCGVLMDWWPAGSVRSTPRNTRQWATWCTRVRALTADDTR
jgi:hypothetical protein